MGILKLFLYELFASHGSTREGEKGEEKNTSSTNPGKATPGKATDPSRHLRANVPWHDGILPTNPTRFVGGSNERRSSSDCLTSGHFRRGSGNFFQALQGYQKRAYIIAVWQDALAYGSGFSPREIQHYTEVKEEAASLKPCHGYVKEEAASEDGTER